jgi:hypothetical protein
MPGAEEPAGAQRRDEGGLVDEAAAAGVDEDRGRAHRRQFGRADEVARLG